jgi:hypothetical protein
MTYYVKILRDQETVGSTLSDTLANAVNFAELIADKGDKVSVHEVLKSADNRTYSIVEKVLSFTSSGKGNYV